VIAFRPAAPGDRHFIVSTWSQSLKPSRYAGLIQAEDWYTVMDAQIGKALERPDVRTLVAFGPEAPELVLGYITFDALDRPPLVYFAYVKEPYRRGGNGRLWSGPGLARRLFSAAGIDPARPFFYACETEVVSRIRRDGKLTTARFEPNRGRYPKATRRSRS
jgi:hypothetical protein